MAPSLHSLGIDRLSLEDRLALAQEIWDSISEETSRLGLNDAQKREIDRRLAAYEANPDTAIPWKEVEAEIRARLRR